MKGTPGFEPGTSRSAVECSTTELYPHTFGTLCFPNVCIFMFMIKKLQYFMKGTPGFEPETSRSAVEYSTTELYPYIFGTLCFPNVCIFYVHD